MKCIRQRARAHTYARYMSIQGKTFDISPPKKVVLGGMRIKLSYLWQNFVCSFPHPTRAEFPQSMCTPISESLAVSQMSGPIADIHIKRRLSHVTCIVWLWLKKKLMLIYHIGFHFVMTISGLVSVSLCEMPPLHITYHTYLHMFTSFDCPLLHRRWWEQLQLK